MKNLRPIAVATDSVVLADPTNINNTTRLKSARSDKTLGGQKLKHSRFEIISARRHQITVNDVAVEDTGAVRIFVSGAVLSAEALVAQLDDAYHNAKIAIQSDKVLEGFPANPTTEYHIDTVTGA